MPMYKLEPYSGVGPLQFGMTEDSLTATIGPAERRGLNRRGEVKLSYPAMELTFDKSGLLAEVTMYPGMDLDINDIDLFGAEDALEQLLRYEHRPLEYVGVLLLPSFGITMLGFHEEDSKSVTAVAKGRLDAVLGKFQPFGSFRRT